jgi:hypothetical protein
MNINLAQVNGVCLTRWRMRALKHLAGAKALVDFGALCGTTEVVPCYKANPCRRFSGKAGASLIFIFRKCYKPLLDGANAASLRVFSSVFARKFVPWSGPRSWQCKELRRSSGRAQKGRPAWRPAALRVSVCAALPIAAR